MAKNKTAILAETPAMESKEHSKREDEWQTRDDVDSILRVESLKQDKRRYNRAANRLKSAARSLGARR